jgi:site-specific recombinase XerD
MSGASIDPLVRSFERNMRAERRSERTIDTYREALEQLSALLHDRGRTLGDATTADIRDYIIDILERRRPSTANNRIRALHRFYGWLEDEEGIPNPMARLPRCSTAISGCAASIPEAPCRPCGSARRRR